MQPLLDFQLESDDFSFDTRSRVVAINAQLGGTAQNLARPSRQGSSAPPNTLPLSVVQRWLLNLVSDGHPRPGAT